TCYQAERAAGGVAPVDDDIVYIQGGGVDKTAAQADAAIYGNAAGAKSKLKIRRLYVVDRNAGAAAAAAVVLVGDRDADGISVAAGRLVEVLVASAAESQHARGQVDRARVVVAPVDHDRVGVERAGVGEAAAQRGRAGFIDRDRAEAELYVGRGDVVDRGVGGAAAAAVVLVGDGRGDAVVSPFTTLFRSSAAVSQHARGQVGRARAVVAPVDHDNVRVDRAGIGERAAHGREAVL